ncbi:hypothetical protein HS1genome_1669 [Sulfodiicoccus acidiphilus]|uniref:Uncharacterized protein n=1 Tax=Sulfodiicoccus acidiphilus TaxID=1670455 RepID=A0A348B528_9CREN|nr:hypothetical protein HS1genome_1669 [Sulfodiicoccus acidiphilus]GGT89402.1 hypothetical protein GCM10007116_04060 [Sulfodiicoccus acidiphilus]
MDGTSAAAPNAITLPKNWMDPPDASTKGGSIQEAEDVITPANPA